MNDRAKHACHVRVRAASQLAIALGELAVGFGLVMSGSAAARETGRESGRPSATELTQHDVIPIMMRRCTVCHGLRQQEAGLDLRTKASMLKGGNSGPAIVPGEPDESLLIKKVRAGEMPPRRRVVEVSVKPIEPAEIELIAKWIELGAPEAATDPHDAGAERDSLVTDNDRAFWSFQPPRRVAVPRVQHTELVRNPIDAFVLTKLEPRGLTLSPEAGRLTLMRRAYLDLTGLPPEPAEVLAHLADDDPAAYDKMIDRLLASPRYGERWGRHWLDVAGYADSEGKTDQDLPRPFAWRYRDYVIRSFNADKPYDRFLIEQIAGDELADYEHAPEITPEIYDNLVATGFLRMAPDGTFANITNFIPDRLEVIADEIQVLASGVIGLTIGCARCHNHKFDPIPQRDYYRLADIFKGAYDEHDWLKPNPSEIASSGKWGHRLLPHVPTDERRSWEAADGDLKEQIASLKAAIDKQVAELKEKYFAERLAKLPPELHDDLRKMLATPAASRSEVERYLAEKFEKTLSLDRDELKKIDAEFKKSSDENEKATKALEAKRQPEPKIPALWDRGEPSPTYILRRGDYLNPGQLVGPGVPAVLTGGRGELAVAPPRPGANSTGRRLAFGRWLARPDNPLTARVMVNRIWKHHFGTGIVKTLGNFGTTGARPTHPELLDWLATEFVKQGWSWKAMHRLILLSNTYRQSSRFDEAAAAKDPENRLLWRMNPRRVEAESLRDSMLVVSGKLNPEMFGPGIYPRIDPDVINTGSRPRWPLDAKDDHSTWRRSVYIFVKRSVILPLIEVFDCPATVVSGPVRAVSTVSPQALALMNNEFVLQQSGYFAERVVKEAGEDKRAQVVRAFGIALNRAPNAKEIEWSLSFLKSQAEGYAQRKSEKPEMAALRDFCHAVINLNEFVYVD